MNEQIEKFISNRPEAIAVYGYGSGVFKQSGYTSKDKPQIDLIIVVDDLRKWHIENMKLNRHDYSLTGKIYFKHAKLSKLKGMTGITYVSNIEENNSVFKYGTIELSDLLNQLNTWEHFYLAGRFQKTIYPIKETDDLRKAIEKNRENALLVATYLQDKDIVAKKDILVTLCGLSYLGDTRMKFAENPRKVLNIVEGSFDEFNKIYKFDNDYLTEENNDTIIIDRNIVLERINDLPKGLLCSIKETLINGDSEAKEKILEYFEELNKKESSQQTLKGLRTNGFSRSIKYALKKLAKRFKK